MQIESRLIEVVTTVKGGNLQMKSNITEKENPGKLKTGRAIYCIFGVLEILFLLKLLFKVFVANPGIKLVSIIDYVIHKKRFMKELLILLLVFSLLKPTGIAS